MVREQIEARGVHDPGVIRAMAEVPREAFVPADQAEFAYLDSPLPIAEEQTISQPYIVALMTELLEVGPGDRVLEIGSGFGYQASILAALGREVFTVELIEELARGARRRFALLELATVQLKIGNGYYGWPEHAPYDKIVVTAAADLIPPPLLAQLKPGGRMVIPTGIPERQALVLVEKSAGGSLTAREVLPVRFSELEEPGTIAGAA